MTPFLILSLCLALSDLSLNASPANSLPGTPKKDFHLNSRGMVGLLDSPRKVDQTFAETVRKRRERERKKNRERERERSEAR